MSQIFYMNGFNVAADEIVYLNLSNPSGQLKPNGSVFNAGGFILSPDGSKIVYYTGSSARLRRGDINPSSNFAIQNTAVLTSGTTGTDREPAFAPDNHRVAFVRGNQIYTINLDGTNQVNISQNSYQDNHPDWSPDGRQIAFVSNRNGDWDIYLASPTNFGQVQRLTHVTFESMSELTWSPDGLHIAFIGREASSAVLNLHIVNVANGSIQNLTGSSSQESSPSWSPNGDQLAFVRLISGWRIYTIRPDGSDETFLVQPSGSDIRQLNWRLPPPNHNGSSYCPICFAANDDAVDVNPISLRLGEKREQVTDLALATPVGTLDFTRVYRQSKQSDYQGMGLGWKHNHDLFIDDSVSNKLIVSLPNAGQAQFSRVGLTTQYNGDPGSNSTIVVNPASTEARYTLTASDQSIYIFDEQKRLRSRQWANGETWAYNYYTSGHADGMLMEVIDGYGRKFQFIYVDKFGEYDHLQLWRVGDQEASGLDGTTPDGRYIEFAYTDEKLDGMPITGAKALLYQIQDVRGQTWTYRYYGQEAGETDGDQANFLVKVVSPEVDIDGDETPDTPIVLKHLTYTLSGGEVRHILQERGFLEGEDPNTGLLRTAYTFLGMQTTQEIVDTQRVVTHRFVGGMLAGSKDPAGNGGSQLITATYRPSKQIDANGNDTTLNWSSSGKLLNSVRDALDHETQFAYDAQERLSRSTDAQERITKYTYGDSNVPRQPTRIQVFDSDGTTLLRQQEFEYNSLGRTLEERTIASADGTTVLQQTTRTYHTAGDGNGLLASVTQVDVEDAGNNQSTSYTYDSAGRVIKTQRSSLFSNCDISFTVYDLAGNVVATICNYDPGTDPDPITAVEAAALYNPAEPDKNRVTTHRYDEMGRRVATTVNAGTGFAQTTLTLYDALDRVVRTIQNFVDDDYAAPGGWVFEEDVWKDEPAGTPISHGGDKTENLIADTAYNARGLTRMRRDVLGNVTLFGYDDADRLVKMVQSASDPGYDNDYSSGDPDLSSYVEDTTTDVDIITLNDYDPVGNLVKTTDPLGRVSFTVYNALNRPVKTVRNAHENATVSLNPEDSGYDAAHDPRASGYAISVDPARDQITTTRYDSLGRVVCTQQLLENRGSSEEWTTTLYGYYALGRQIKSIRSASQPNYDIAADPDLSAYVASSAADLDIISTTVYEDQGRVLYNEDVLGNRTWTAYNGLGRPIKTIINAVGTATDDGTSDPRSSNYTPSTAADKDLISHTVYDDDGRVLETVDLLGRVTRQVYDTLGRQVRTVSNYVDNSYNDPADWVWESGQWRDAPAGTVISRGDHHDQNIVSTTKYDDQGRVWKTFDQRYNESHMVYDTLGRRIMTIGNYIAQASEPEVWVWDAGDGRWEDGAGTAIDHGSANDLNQISTTTYDIAGRVTASRDNAGLQTRYEYDALGRQVKTIRNYVNGVYTPAAPDEDLMSETQYNKVGQMIATVDPRGTQTTFTYDAAGRRLSVIQAAGTPLATQSYTCYDKAGRIRRSIQNYLPLVDAEDEPILPDTYAAGVWAFNPTQHGPYQDQNLITEFIYDAASRQVQVIDPVGNTTATSYTKDGQVDTVTDAEGVETLYRYDQLRRRTRVVQSFVAQGSNDPAAWVWNKDATPEPRWEDGSNNALNHGADQDQNIIVDVTYDKAGRMLSLRNPRGYETQYTYDALNRRLKLTNALAIPLPDPWGWITKYSDLPTGGTRVEQTYPGLSSSGIYTVERDFDRLGRLSSIDYDSPTTTPSVRFSYDAAGSRQAMTEYGGMGFTNPVRETVYAYDAMRRLTSVGFDNDSDGTVEEMVSYAYDAGGLRTRLTLPGNLDITYLYDAKGQLVSLTDWDSQQTQLSYDQVGRHIATRRANGLRSRYSYDAASRLRKLRHSTSQRTLGHFEYQVDKRGNRTQALEVLPHPATTSDTLLTFDDASLIYTGSWSDSSPFKVTDSPSSSLKTLFYGSQIEFAFGTGPDHGLFDVYIGKTLYQSYDGYAATSGERSESVNLTGEGPFLFEIRNRPEHNANATGYRLRFKQLLIPDVVYDLHTIDYTYDAISRLQQADYNSGDRVYDFDYDLAGNRLQEALSGTGVTAKTTDYEYNVVNQINRMRVDTGTWTDFTYDNNGNLTDDGVKTYTWDRANRLLSMGGASYQYDGLNNRVQQTVGANVTKYLLDLQPGLAVVLAETTGANVVRNVHTPRGIHSHKDAAGAWEWMVQDGLGSVRGVVDNSVVVLESRNYDPYGTGFGATGTNQTNFGFTGEQTDGTGLVYLRARYYNPAAGVFTALDPFEGTTINSASLNGYGYVWSNPVNRADASGLCPQMTIEQTRNAVRTLQAANPSFMSVDGATADTIASIVCAAQDFGQYAPQVVTIGGTAVEVAVAIAGTGAAATAGVVIAAASVGILLGVGIYLGLQYAPLPYTPEELGDMRPPTPLAVTPNPNVTLAPQPQPVPQATLAPGTTLAPQPVQTPCNEPTVTTTPEPRRVGNTLI